MLGRAIGAPFWGWLADQNGRKPVLMISLCSIAVGSLGLGLASNLETAVLSLLLSGIFCNLSSTAKTCVSEIASSSLQPKAMSYYTLGWFYGQIAGYLIGGLLVHPENTGWVSDGILVEYPYLLPNLVCASGAVLTLIGVHFCYKETLVRSTVDLDNTDDTSYLRSNKGLIAFYVFQVFSNTGFIEIFPVWCWASAVNGGLRLSAAEIGVTLTAAYAVLGFGQRWVYNCFVRFLGLKRTTIYSSFLLCPVLVAFPCISLLSDLSLKVALAGGCLVFYMLSYNVFTSLFVMINWSVVQKDRAKLNGCAMGIGYIVKGITPLVVDYSFAYTSESGQSFPFDHHFIFTVLGLSTAFSAVYALMCIKVTPRAMEIDTEEAGKDLEKSSNKIIGSV